MLVNYVHLFGRISLAFTLIMAVGGCGNSYKIEGEYRLYDLGGSNSAIGRNGAIEVNHVSAWLVKGKMIFFEVNDPENWPKGGQVSLENCKYGVINTIKNSIEEVSIDDREFAEVKFYLKNGKASAEKTSCLLH